MYVIGDYIVYKRYVCKVSNIKVNHFNSEDYYVLQPTYDESLTIEVPTSNKDIRPLIKKSKIKKILEQSPDIKIIQTKGRLIENEYKRLLKLGTPEDLITIIKTTNFRNQSRTNLGKKRSDKDEFYFGLAEKYLFDEFSIVLNMSYNDTKEYIYSYLTKYN